MEKFLLSSQVLGTVCTWIICFPAARSSPGAWAGRDPSAQGMDRLITSFSRCLWEILCAELVGGNNPPFFCKHDCRKTVERERWLRVAAMLWAEFFLQCFPSNIPACQREGRKVMLCMNRPRRRLHAPLPPKSSIS